MTPYGEVVDRVQVAAGATVGAPIRLINRSKAIWGNDAHEFVPSRWMSSEASLPEKVKEIHGYSHILTFVDGQRTCLGKQFAILEFKVLSSTMFLYAMTLTMHASDDILGGFGHSHSPF